MSVYGTGGRHLGGGLVTALIVLVCALVVPAIASAEEFTVNSTADEVDALLGNGVCLTAGGKCTLRAAIQELNSSGESGRFDFDEAVFDGQSSSTITLTSGLPAIKARVLIHGRECPTAAGISGPCVGIDGTSGEPALSVEHEEVEIEGLAVTGAETAISVNGSPHFLAQENWFGIKLDGSSPGNGTGILIGPGSNRSLIGSEGAERRNVIAGSSGDGLDIQGASNVRVLGNYFGVEPDGATRAANGTDIKVASVPEFEVVGTAIGTRITFENAATTPGCDGGCNVISGATSSGIDLEGGGVEEAPPVATTIAGNYIGLDATGTVPIPNIKSGLRVGEAAQTVIGGPKASEANRINGGDVGVLAGPAAADLVVRGNLIGVNAAGTGKLAPPGEGIVVNSGELPTPAVEAVIVGNEIRMEGGVAIAQQGFGARISGNEIFGAETGIKTFESIGEHGNLIEGNSIEFPEVDGILVENNLNEISGNEISDAGGAGIRIQGSLPFGFVMENLIGGDVATEENVIAGSGGDAIEISDLEGTENEVARNRGIANDGLFIDLVAISPSELKGPNDGIKPPAFLAPTQASASGSAKAGARVRVFRKQGSEAGELESFLGEATADASGNWKVTYGSAIPGGTIVAATQTSKEGGTSELATAMTAAEPGGGGGGGSSGGGSQAGKGTSPPADQTLPETKIVKAPKKKSQSDTARFEFDSDEPGSTFQCKLDRKPFRACESPKKYKHLKPGKHAFRVRAIDPAGNVDSSPAKRKFTVR